MPATCSGYRPAKILTYSAPDEWPTNTNGPGMRARSSKRVQVRRHGHAVLLRQKPDRSNHGPRDRTRIPACRGASAVEIHPQ